MRCRPIFWQPYMHSCLCPATPVIMVVIGKARQNIHTTYTLRTADHDSQCATHDNSLSCIGLYLYARRDPGTYRPIIRFSHANIHHTVLKAVGHFLSRPTTSQYEIPTRTDQMQSIQFRIKILNYFRKLKKKTAVTFQAFRPSF